MPDLWIIVLLVVVLGLSLWLASSTYDRAAASAVTEDSESRSPLNKRTVRAAGAAFVIYLAVVVLVMALRGRRPA